MAYYHELMPLQLHEFVRDDATFGSDAKLDETFPTREDLMRRFLVLDLKFKIHTAPEIQPEEERIPVCLPHFRRRDKEFPDLVLSQF